MTASALRLQLQLRHFEKSDPQFRASLGNMCAPLQRHREKDLRGLLTKGLAKARVRSIAAPAAVALAALILQAGCPLKPGRQANSSPSPAPQATPLIAYLREGDLWVMGSGGESPRRLASAPEGEAINEFIWSSDGQRIFYLVGFRLLNVLPSSGKSEPVAEISLPPGTTIDGLELARDGETLLAHCLDANAAPVLFSPTKGGHEVRELAIDQYEALAPARPVTIRRYGQMSVSPDTRQVLFKAPVGPNEELFVADVETGARRQLTELDKIEGFEQSAEEVGRRILEAAWSPDGRYVIFNPAQACSDTGLCYGKLYVVGAWGGAITQLSHEMMVTVPVEWKMREDLLTYDDGSEILVSDVHGATRRLAEGSSPRWQPAVPAAVAAK
jgi:Tol biopolymer transport system component